ncbi:hypothetical protein Scep_008033 [Stephania cephalantha]|uniref:DYW domain-containing protein n=1 Tax=Stephania cephalantha TaxID=152367 RepID=A0AAP0PQL1_9MAGN
MENSILPTKSKPPFPNLFKQQNTPFQFLSNPTKPPHFHIKSPKLALQFPTNKGQLQQAVTALDALARRKSKVNPETYVSLLQSCIDLDSIDLGRQLHSLIGLVDNVDCFVETKLVSMYVKCGNLEDARQVFDEMPERNLFTYTTMIGGYSREQRHREILKLFWGMVDEGVVPDEFLMPRIVRACANVGNLEMGELAHSFVIRSGLVGASVQVGNSLLSMYAKCGELRLARKLFEKMDEKDGVSWNSIISGYCQFGVDEEALRLFNEMQDQGVQPGLVTWNTLIASHSQCGNCELAMELKEEMKSCGIVPDVVTWTSMISGFTKNNRSKQALELFSEMLMEGIEPNAITIASATTACVSLKTLKKGKELHSVGIKIGAIGDVLLGNSLIELYSKCGNLEAAQRTFDLILEKDVFTWNLMIGGFAQAGYCGKAYDLFMKMQDLGVPPNVITWNTMISGYIRNGDEDHAMNLFGKMEERGAVKRNTASWNLLIAGLLLHGRKDKALAIFRQMQASGVLLNSITLLSVLPACANLIAWKKVKEIHCYVIRGRLESDVSVANSLIDTYAKAGDLTSARSIFVNLHTKDIITWNSLMNGYVVHGCPDITLDLFDHMKSLGVEANRGTFACVLLAHSLAGMVDEGKQTFSSMSEEYHISPGLEHYSAMVDLLGRSGRHGEATKLIDEMNLEPDFSVWTALLRASRVHGNMRLAIHAAENLIEIEPRNLIVRRLLTQLYGLDGRAVDSLTKRKPRKRNGTTSILGLSWLEVKNKVYSFMTGDHCMPYSDSIYAQLDNISRKIKAMGPDSHKSELCIEEEEKEEICGVHSEKLAIAFALLSSPDSLSCIRIIKNFRMCGDCHRAAKLVSLMHRQEIYVHDSKILHHFKDGRCSCRDYW